MTDQNNLDKAIAYLGTALKDLANNSKPVFDFNDIVKAIPKRGLSGDHITGGTITGFSSLGIKDDATAVKLTVSNDGVKIGLLAVDQIQGNLAVSQNITAQNLTLSGHLKAATIEVTEILSDTRIERSASLEFKKTETESLDNKGLWWIGEGYAKQFVYKAYPDRFFSTEIVDVHKDKHYAINGIPILNSTELGNTVVKSSLRELGRLKGLIVDGDVIIDQYIVYNSNTNRLGIGTEEPNAALSIFEDGVEVLLGTKEQTRGIVGTFASLPFDIVTDNTARITIQPNGDIILGNQNQFPSKVFVHGKLSIGAKNPDERAALHVQGSIKFDDRLHQYGERFPSSGNYNKGDVVWNTEPRPGSYIGWVCISAGAPGIWLPFGDIKPTL
jgi:hypothetical protein